MSLLFSVNAIGVDFKVGGMYYNYNITSKENLTVSLTAPDYRGHYEGDIVIPEHVTYNNKKYRVTSLDDKSFRGCSKLTSLTIPKSIISVETSFMDCKNLKSVTLYCKNVVDYMFYQRASLREVILGEGVETVGKKAFCRCGRLHSLTISNTVTSIGDEAFYGCDLVYVTIPSSVRSIGTRAFEDCIDMYKLVISEGVKTIGNYAFYNCKNLRMLEIPSSVRSIGEEAFAECINMHKLVISEGVETIGDNAFSYCRKLQTIELPNGIKEWGDGPFSGCSLYSVSVPKHYAEYYINKFYASKIIIRDK